MALAIPTLDTTALQSVDSLNANFKSMATDISSSCDLMGTITALAEQITQTIQDSVTGAITTVKRFTADIAADIKDKLSSIFSGSGSTLNSVKGYIDKAKQMMASLKSKLDKLTDAAQEVYRSVVDKIQSLMADIGGVIRTITAKITEAVEVVKGAMVTLSNAVTDCVGSVKLATCGAIGSVLAGSPSDAFANITKGATDTVGAALGAAKDVYNTGADSLSAVFEKMTDSSGIGNVMGNISSSTGDAVTKATSQGDNVSLVGSKVSEIEQLVQGIPG